MEQTKKDLSHGKMRLLASLNAAHKAICDSKQELLLTEEDILYMIAYTKDKNNILEQSHELSVILGLNQTFCLELIKNPSRENLNKTVSNFYKFERPSN
jgi:hypothetical protein